MKKKRAREVSDLRASLFWKCRIEVEVRVGKYRYLTATIRATFHAKRDEMTKERSVEEKRK